MKLIKCVLATDRLDACKQALLNQGVQGMTVYQAQGVGIHRSQISQKVSQNYLVEFQPRIVIELVVADVHAAKTVKLLASVCKTGRLGDGKLFVLPVEEAVRLRTGERGEAVL